MIISNMTLHNRYVLQEMGVYQRLVNFLDITKMSMPRLCALSSHPPRLPFNKLHVRLLRYLEVIAGRTLILMVLWDFQRSLPNDTGQTNRSCIPSYNDEDMKEKAVV